jgi:hypothetical protein
MSADNVTPIAAAGRAPRDSALAIRIERLRQRLLTEAMPFVETTRRALEPDNSQDDHYSECEVLHQAWRIMGDVSMELCEISGGPRLPEDDPAG